MKPMVVTPDTAANYHPIFKSGEQTQRMQCGCVGLADGDEIGEHSTKGHEEVLVILEGAGTVVLEGHDNLKVRAGDVAYIPPHTAHNVVNTEGDRLRYVYIVAPVSG